MYVDRHETTGVSVTLVIVSKGRNSYLKTNSIEMKRLGRDSPGRQRQMTLSMGKRL
jgi:hypothetical protein